jgi:hypothetical protein
MKRIFGLLLVVVGVLGCIEESKTDCRNDGDCRGVRVCRDGECFTPEGFQNNGLPPRDTGGSADAGDGGTGDDVAVVDTGLDGGPDGSVSIDSGTADAGTVD